jgi:hypothetical protein
MNRTRKFALNTIATGAYQLTAMLLGFLTPGLMIRFYTDQINGLIVSITEFINYFRLVEAGLASVAVYSLYQPLARRDHAGVNAVVSAASAYYRRTALLFTGITVVFAAVYPFVVRVSSLSAFSVFGLVLVMGLSGALDMLTLARYRVLLTADQKTYAVSFASMASLLAQTALIVILGTLRVNILLLRFLAGLTILLRTLLLHQYVKKRYPYLNTRSAPNKSALRNRFDALYHQLTAALQQSLGAVLTTLLWGSAETLSIYGVYHMVVIGIWGILKMVTTGIYSFFGEIIALKDAARLKRVYNDFECFYLTLIACVFSAALILVMPFITLYTRDFTQVSYIRPLWGALFILQGLTDQARMPLDVMILAAGAFKQTRRHNTVQTVAAVALGAVLGWFFGVPGVLAGIILSNLIRGVLQLVYVPKHITGQKKYVTVRRAARMAATVALCWLPFYFTPLTPNRFAAWLLDALWVTPACAALACAFAWLFDREAARSLWNRAGAFIRRS